MRKTVIALVALGLVVASSAFASNAVRISQVYGGGGGSSTAWKCDYVELFNSSCSPIDISGWAVEYGSATGNWGSFSGNIVVIPAGTSIKACGYYLVGGGCSTGTAGNPLPVTPDVSGGLAMSATDGKVGLFNQVNANVACNSEVGLQDKVAYGSGGCAEVAATAALTNVKVDVRKGAGTQDTDNNLNDFVVTDWTLVTVHNSLSPLNPDCQLLCGACCYPDYHCALVTEVVCQAAGGAWYAGLDCDHITCVAPPPVGACCNKNYGAGTGYCLMLTRVDCLGGGGTWAGAGVPCPNDCAVVDAAHTTWGKIKTLYR